MNPSTGNGGILALVLLGHSRSLADDEGLREGHYDSPLTEAGRLQVQRRAGEFRERGLRVDLIVSSPLQRARAAAEIFAEELLAPVELGPDWMEMDNGLLGRDKAGDSGGEVPQTFLPLALWTGGGMGKCAWGIYCWAARALRKGVRGGAGTCPSWRMAVSSMPPWEQSCGCRRLGRRVCLRRPWVCSLGMRRGPAGMAAAGVSGWAALRRVRKARRRRGRLGLPGASTVVPSRVD